MGNTLSNSVYCFEPRKKEKTYKCKKCNLEYSVNIKNCSKHKFRKNKKNILICKHCGLRNNQGNTLCYHYGYVVK